MVETGERDRVRCDVVIVGSGPAGLSAATAIRSRGGSVMVVDENPRPGGKLLGQLHEHPQKGWWRGQQIADEMMTEAKALGVQFMNQTQVWALERGWTVRVSNLMNRDDSPHVLSSRAVLLATGAVEKPVLVPGWTLPGVMTVGAAQVLTNVYGVKPGLRVLIAGVNPLSLTVARQLSLVGIDVVGIVLPPSGEFSEMISNPEYVLGYLSTMAHLAPGALLRRGGRLLRSENLRHFVARLYPSRGVRVWGIPLQLRTALVGVQGDEQVQSVVVQALTPHGQIIPGTQSRIRVDAVCLSGGLAPLAELAATAGCRFANIPELGGSVPLHGADMQTTVADLFVAGNITGVESAKVAMAQGSLAGLSICRNLGLGRVTDDELSRAEKRVEQERNLAEIQFYPRADEGRVTLRSYWTERMVRSV